MKSLKAFKRKAIFNHKYKHIFEYPHSFELLATKAKNSFLFIPVPFFLILNKKLNTYSFFTRDHVRVNK